MDIKYRCRYCDKSFHNKSNLNRHVKLIHEVVAKAEPNTDILCKDCKTRFYTISQLRNHLREAHAFDVKKVEHEFASERGK